MYNLLVALEEAVLWPRGSYTGTLLHITSRSPLHTVTAVVLALALVPFLAVLPRPHLIVTFSPSISNPLAQACAAISAAARSLKLTNAHLKDT